MSNLHGFLEGVCLWQGSDISFATVAGGSLDAKDLLRQPLRRTQRKVKILTRLRCDHPFEADCEIASSDRPPGVGWQDLEVFRC